MQSQVSSLLAAAVAAVAFVGCTSDDDFAPQRESSGVKQSLTFTANADGGGAKCYAYGRQKTHLMDDGRSVAFDADDAISVFDGVDNNEFRTEDGGTSVYLTGEAVETANYTALYPYQSGASLSGTTLTATLPTEQKAVLNSYDPQANLSVATTTKEAMSFGFKNVCALVKFDTAEPLKKVVFYGNSSENVAGALSIDMSNADAPSVTGHATSITLLPAEGKAAIPAGTYYIAVLPQNFSEGFTLEAYTVSNTSSTADYSLNTPAITLQRRGIMDVRLLNANGYDYVDLGIEVGGYKVLWATMNVGATTSEGYGDYFAWGETAPKSNYAWDNYAWGTSSALTKYTATDGKTQLELADDAARQNWGGDWVMPTVAECEALCGNTTNAWTTNYNGTGINGWKFTSTIASSKSIFLPAAGYFSGTSVRNVGTNGLYGALQLNADDATRAYNLYFSSGDVNPAGDGRYYGRSVRPVLRIPVSQITITQR